jgi:epothilone polyketide synthase D
VLEYLSIDGRKIPAVLSMPRGAGPFPVVVTIHGGEGDREISFLRTLAISNDATPTVVTLNAQPWAVLAIDFRSGLFGLEEEDVVAGIRFAKTLPRVDAARVGVLGGSRGGHLALRAAEIMGRNSVAWPWARRG